MRVRDREHVEAVPRQTAREVEEQGGHGSRPQGHRSGEPSGEFGGGIGEWRGEHGGRAMSGEPRRGSAGPPLPQDDVGCKQNRRGCCRGKGEISGGAGTFKKKKKKQN